MWKDGFRVKLVLFLHIFWGVSIWRDCHLTGRTVLPIHARTRTCVLWLNWHFTETQKPQRQSRTRYERERKKWMAVPPGVWQWNIPALLLPSCFMRVPDGERTTGQPTVPPLSLLPFLSSSAPQERACLLSVTCRVGRAAEFGQTQRVICFIQKTNFYFSLHTFPCFFFLFCLFFFFSQSVSRRLHVFCKLNLEGTSCPQEVRSSTQWLRAFPDLHG